MTRGIWRATSLNVSSETNFHSVSGGGGGPGSATFSLAFTRDIYFLYRNDPSTSTTGVSSRLALCILRMVQNICHVNTFITYMTIESTLVQSVMLEQYLSIENATINSPDSNSTCSPGSLDSLK